MTSPEHSLMPEHDPRDEPDPQDELALPDDQDVRDEDAAPPTPAAELPAVEPADAAAPKPVVEPPEAPQEPAAGEPADSQVLEPSRADADIPASPLTLEPDTTILPDGDLTPGVLRETPVGARLPPEPTESALRDMPTPQELAAAQPAPETPPAPEQEIAAPPAAEVEPEPGPVSEEEAPLFPFTAEDAEAAAAFDALFAADEDIAEVKIPSAGPSPTEAAEPGKPPEAPAPSASVVRAEDWDEELSPELAAVLFGAASERAQPAEAEAAPAPAQPEEPAAPAPAIRAEPEAVAPAKPGGPVMVTTPDEARSRPLVAGQFTSPPPNAPIHGDMRYIRLEEPLRGKRGRRIHETWEYFGPDYPALDGRLVKRVESEEFAYADGSWKLTFRRDYSQGSDERTVRIASDGEYAERTDHIRRRDAATNKTRSEREQVGVRCAPLPSEEKRSFLGSLFGRGNTPQAEGPKSWRPATDAERREARRNGGAAFKYGIFERQ